jgi:hypothetical protein
MVAAWWWIAGDFSAVALSSRFFAGRVIVLLMIPAGLVAILIAVLVDSLA